MNCEWVRQNYGVPAEIGRRVTCSGKEGIIAKDMGNYIGVLLDSDEPNNILPYHPTSDVVYGEIGIVRQPKKLTKSQKRYQEYLVASDWFNGTFAEWMGWVR